MKMPRPKKPVPDDPELAEMVAELKKIVRKVERAEDRVADLVAERDRLVVDVLTRFDVSQAQVAQRIGLKRENVARILALAKRTDGKTERTSTSSQTANTAVSNVKRRRSK